MQNRHIAFADKTSWLPDEAKSKIFFGLTLDWLWFQTKVKQPDWTINFSHTFLITLFDFSFFGMKTKDLPKKILKKSKVDEQFLESFFKEKRP